MASANLNTIFFHPCQNLDDNANVAFVNNGAYEYTKCKQDIRSIRIAIHIANSCIIVFNETDCTGSPSYTGNEYHGECWGLAFSDSFGRAKSIYFE